MSAPTSSPSDAAAVLSQDMRVAADLRVCGGLAPGSSPAAACYYHQLDCERTGGFVCDLYRAKSEVTTLPTFSPILARPPTAAPSSEPPSAPPLPMLAPVPPAMVTLLDTRYGGGPAYPAYNGETTERLDVSTGGFYGAAHQAM